MPINIGARAVGRVGADRFFGARAARALDTGPVWHTYYPTYYPYAYPYIYPVVTPALYSTYLGYYTPWRVYGPSYVGPLVPTATENDGYVKALAAHSAASEHPPMTFAEFEAAMSSGASSLDPAKVSDVRAGLRHLWQDHVSLTRNLIISTAAKLPDADTVAARLAKNTDEIGEALKSYYGDGVGDVARALRDHATSTGDVLTAVKAGDAAKTDKAKAAWYANGDDLARALADLNSHWALADMQRLVKAHLDATLEEATARVQSRWADDLSAYDRVVRGAMDAADALALGIVEQFPDKFAR